MKKILITLMFCVLTILNINCKNIKIPKDDKNFASEYFHILVNNDIDSAFTYIDTSIINENTKAGLDYVKNNLSQCNLDSAEIINFFTKTSSVLFSTDKEDKKQDTRYTTIDYQFKNNEKWIFLNVGIKTFENKKSIYNLIINIKDKPIEELTKIDFSVGNGLNYLFVLIAIFNICFILYTEYLLVRSDFKRKFIWAIFIILGIFQIYTYWGLENISINFFIVHIFGVSYVGPSIDQPLRIMIGIPLGAIIFNIKRRKKIKIQEFKKMFISNETLPELIICPFCSTELVLEEEERKHKNLTCIKCNKKLSNDM